MRRVRKTLEKNGDEDIADLSWKKALATASGEESDYDEEWMEKQAKEWAGRLLKAFGDRPQGHCDGAAVLLAGPVAGTAKCPPMARRGG